MSMKELADMAAVNRQVSGAENSAIGGNMANMVSRLDAFQQGLNAHSVGMNSAAQSAKSLAEYQTQKPPDEQTMQSKIGHPSYGGISEGSMGSQLRQTGAINSNGEISGAGGLSVPTKPINGVGPHSGAI